MSGAPGQVQRDLEAESELVTQMFSAAAVFRLISMPRGRMPMSSQSQAQAGIELRSVSPSASNVRGSERPLRFPVLTHQVGASEH